MTFADETTETNRTQYEFDSLWRIDSPNELTQINYFQL